MRCARAPRIYARPRRRSRRWSSTLPDVVAGFDSDLRHLTSALRFSTSPPPSQAFVGQDEPGAGDVSDLNEVWDAPCEESSATGPVESSSSPFGSGWDAVLRLPARSRARPWGRHIISAERRRDVTDRWLMYEAERRGPDHCGGIARGDRGAHRCLDRETVLVNLLDRLRRMVPFDRASVMLLE